MPPGSTYKEVMPPGSTSKEVMPPCSTSKEVMPPGSIYNPSVVIQGKLYHTIGPLQASAGDTPKFAQIYVHDPLHEKKEASIRLDPYFKHKTGHTSFHFGTTAKFTSTPAIHVYKTIPGQAFIISPSSGTDPPPPAWGW